jgi:predicted nucleic-acid-binding Zn-ribbon protein
MRVFQIISTGKKIVPCPKCSHKEFHVPEVANFRPLPVRLTRGSYIEIICKKCKVKRLYKARKNESIIFP